MATAPAATVDIVMESGSKGRFADLLLSVVALDDAWGLILFSVGLALVAVLSGVDTAASPLWLAFSDIGGAALLGVLIGLLWLATVPVTSGLVGQLFGARYLGTLYGIVFLGHQAGAFFGAWWAGRVFESTGSYDTVWWVAVVLSALAALIHRLIDDRPARWTGEERAASV